MTPRPVIIASLLGASVGVPYAVSHSQKGTFSEWRAKLTAESVPADAVAQPPIARLDGSVDAPGLVPGSGVTIVGVTPAGTSLLPIEQVFRFDLTKEWVYQQWPRKTTGPTDVGLFSVRVPLVTGTQSHDVAGSLTYFFNAAGAVEHISFRGRTGDPRYLVHFLQRTYQFEAEEAPPGEVLMQVKRTGVPQSEYRSRQNAILTNASPLSNYELELELARPGSKRLLPPRPLPFAPPPDLAAGAATTPVEGAPGAPSEPASGYLDQVRFATPEEESQVYRMRWPN